MTHIMVFTEVHLFFVQGSRNSSVDDWIGGTFAGDNQNQPDLMRKQFFKQMGVSENSVPLNPMVNDHYPY